MKTRYICLTMFCLFASLAHGQQKIIADFENTSPTAYWGWDEQPEVVINPFKTGINTSNKVLQWKKSKGGWKAFVISMETLDVKANPVINFKFYSPVKGNIGARIETGTDSETVFFDFDITETNQWVNFSKDLASLLKSVKSFSQVTFFINPGKDDDTSTYYLDDLKFAQK